MTHLIAMWLTMTYPGPLLSEQDRMLFLQDHSIIVLSLRNQDLSQWQGVFYHTSASPVCHSKSRGTIGGGGGGGAFLTALHLTEGAINQAGWRYSWSCTQHFYLRHGGREANGSGDEHYPSI